MIILRPGVVKSKTDGELHHISAKELIKLYQILKSIPTKLYNPREHYPDSTVFLNPLYEGNYAEVANKLGLWEAHNVQH